MQFPAKKSQVKFGLLYLRYLLIELFYIGMPLVLTDGGARGRTDERSRDYKSLFTTARETSAINVQISKPVSLKRFPLAFLF